MRKTDIKPEHSMITVFSVLVCLLMGAAIISCGSSSDDNPPPPKLNHLFSGTYYYYVMEQDESSESPPVVGYIINANGDGTASIITNTVMDVDYTVSSDRTITMLLEPAYENLYGRISANGDVFALTDTVYDIATSDVELGIGVRNSSGRSDAEFSGLYNIYQTGVKNTSGEFYTARVGIIANGDGTGKWDILNHSMGHSGIGNFTSSLNPDGTFIVNNGAFEDQGIVSPDGSFFVIADISNTDGDDEWILSVGIKNSSTVPDIAGGSNFLISQVGLQNGTPEEYTARIYLTIGASDYSFEIRPGDHSLGDTGSLGGIPYSVSSDGTINNNNPGVLLQAIQNGTVMALAGIDNVIGNELVFGIGLQ